MNASEFKSLDVNTPSVGDFYFPGIGKGTDKYKEIDKEIRHMCKERKEAWWNEKCKEIEELERKHNTKEMHSKLKEMSTKKRSKSGTNCIRHKHGENVIRFK